MNYLCFAMPFSNELLLDSMRVEFVNLPFCSLDFRISNGTFAIYNRWVWIRLGLGLICYKVAPQFDFTMHFYFAKILFSRISRDLKQTYQM